MDRGIVRLIMAWNLRVGTSIGCDDQELFSRARLYVYIYRSCQMVLLDNRWYIWIR